MDGDLIPPESNSDNAIPKGKMEKVFEQVEMMALRKSNSVDINALNDTQKLLLKIRIKMPRLPS